MTDPARCECGTPKPSIHEYCSPECEVKALRKKAADVEAETIEAIARWVDGEHEYGTAHAIRRGDWRKT